MYVYIRVRVCSKRLVLCVSLAVACCHHSVEDASKCLDEFVEEIQEMLDEWSDEDFKSWVP